MNKQRKLYDKILIVVDGLDLKVMANGHRLAKLDGNTVYFDTNVYVEIFENGLIARGMNGGKIYYDKETNTISEVDYEQNEILFS